GTCSLTVGDAGTCGAPHSSAICLQLCNYAKGLTGDAGTCSTTTHEVWRPSTCCQTTSPMRHCKTDSYKHDSQRQRHDGTYSFATARGLPV
ncbi:unnamed protein product, partial [Staurois parvus]